MPGNNAVENGRRGRSIKGGKGVGRKNENIYIYPFLVEDCGSSREDTGKPERIHPLVEPPSWNSWLSEVFALSFPVANGINAISWSGECETEMGRGLN